MKYTFAEWKDGTIITFSDIKVCNAEEYIRMYFEKPVPTGFYFLETRLPALDVVSQDGFSPDELNHLLTFAKDNASRIWEFARSRAPLQKKGPSTSDSAARRALITNH